MRRQRFCSRIGQEGEGRRWSRGWAGGLYTFSFEINRATQTQKKGRRLPLRWRKSVRDTVLSDGLQLTKPCLLCERTGIYSWTSAFYTVILVRRLLLRKGPSYCKGRTPGEISLRGVSSILYALCILDARAYCQILTNQSGANQAGPAGLGSRMLPWPPYQTHQPLISLSRTLRRPLRAPSSQ